MSETLTENTDKIQKPWLFQKGQSGNPAGKPPGAKNKFSPTQQLQAIWEGNPELFDDFVMKWMKNPKNQQHIVEMIDGRPQGSERDQNINIVIPILGGISVHSNDSNPQIAESEEEN
jgi:hypothetical protein